MGDRIDIFHPTPPQAQHLLDLLQRADCSLEDIAEALRTSVAALTVYLVSNDAIDILAQAELADARRSRSAATGRRGVVLHGVCRVTSRVVARRSWRKRRGRLRAWDGRVGLCVACRRRFRSRRR